jgi:hypothetical protein
LSASSNGIRTPSVMPATALPEGLAGSHLLLRVIK